MNRDASFQAHVQKEMNEALSFLDRRASLEGRIINQFKGENQMSKKRNIVVCVAILLLLMIGTAAAFTLSQDFFRDVAHLTLESGDYEDWSLDEKRYMLDIMAKYGLLDEQTAAEAQRQSESAIDDLMLDRYGMESCPDDLSAISLTRIAWVEMGPYTDWSNET